MVAGKNPGPRDPRSNGSVKRMRGEAEGDMKIRRHDSNPKVAELRQLPIFSGLGGKQLDAMAANLDEARLEQGERVMQEGRYNDTFWIILEGSVDLTIGGRVHETLGRGDVFGLPSMFTGREAMADGVATSEVRALVASHRQFNGLIADHEVEIRFKAAMFDRLRDEVYQLTHRAAARSAAKAPVRSPAKSPARSARGTSR